MKLTPQQRKILDLLNDGEWHCSVKTIFIKDDRKRISELKKLGYNIEGRRCDKHCGINHSSGIFMRRWVKVKPAYTYTYDPERNVMIQRKVDDI